MKVEEADSITPQWDRFNRIKTSVSAVNRLEWE